MNLELISQNLPLFTSASIATAKIFFWSAFFSLAISVIAGTVASGPVLFARWFARAFIEFFRAVPQIVSVFFVFFGAPAFGLQLGAVEATIVSLSLWGGANGAEIVRGGINSVPRHQSECAQALGLSGLQTAVLIIVPQAIRPIVPAYAGLCTVLLQSTTLGALIGATELLRGGQIVIERSFYFQGGAPALSVYAFILCVFFAASWLMTAGTRRLEKVFEVPSYKN